MASDRRPSLRRSRPACLSQPSSPAFGLRRRCWTRTGTSSSCHVRPDRRWPSASPGSWTRLSRSRFRWWGWPPERLLPRPWRAQGPGSRLLPRPWRAQGPGSRVPPRKATAAPRWATGAESSACGTAGVEPSCPSWFSVPASVSDTGQAGGAYFDACEPPPRKL